MKRLKKSSLVAPLVVAAALRLMVLAAALMRTGVRVLAGGDTPSYLEPGRNLLFHGSFTTAGLVEIGRTPGYPLFLAAVSGAGLAVAALVQVALSVVSVWLVARLARAAFVEERGVVWAAWLMAFEPLAVVYAPRLLSETLFCALLLVSLERLTVFIRRHAMRNLVWSGLVLAAAIFVRPAAYFLPALWSMGLVVVFWRQRGLRWKAPLVLLASTLPLLALWQVRNGRESGYTGFSSIAVRNTYFYSAAEIEAQAQGKSFGAMQREFGYPDESAYRAAHPEQAEWGEARRLAFMKDESSKILRTHWAEAVRTQLVGSAVVVLTPSAAELFEMLDADSAGAQARVVHEGPLRAAWRVVRTDPVRAITMAVFEAWLLVLYLLMARGVCKGKLQWPVPALLLGTALYFVAVSGGVQAVGRFRLPVMPLVCVLAAVGVVARRKPAK